MSGKLEKSTAYLSGAMEYVKDGGVFWRRKFIKLVKEANLKIDCIDPTSKPGNINEDKITQKELQQNGCWEQLKTYVSNYRRSDLRFVDLSDFIVCFVDPTVPQWGTANEVFEAERQHKPSFFICEGGLYTLPRWLFGVIQLENENARCNVFNSVEEVIDELIGLDKGIYPMDSEWVLIRKELENLRFS